MRVTIEASIDTPTTDMFLDLYRSAFMPLDRLAAARQRLTDDEFREHMADDTVLKFVGRNAGGEPIALALVATDLDTVPWISPEFWRDRYPDHAARGAIWYFGAMLVSPTEQGGLWIHRLLSEDIRTLAKNGAVAAFDCCQLNVEGVKVPQMVADVGHRLANLTTELVDTQSYYAYVFEGLRDEIDLRGAETAQSQATASEAATGRSATE